MSSKKGIMYRILPFNGIWTNRDVSEVVNGIMNGKINATGTIKLVITKTDDDDNYREIEKNAEGNWDLRDERIALESVILFTARANPQSGLPYVKTKSKGKEESTFKAVLGYEGTVPATFDYVVLG
tara:strand:+ start:197 stop:574 length:378 start_codon:yes stop_codon:yes gene_type:complete